MTMMVMTVVQTDGAHAIARSCSQLGLLRRCNDVVRHRFAILLLQGLLLQRGRRSCCCYCWCAVQIVGGGRRHSTFVCASRAVALAVQSHRRVQELAGRTLPGPTCASTALHAPEPDASRYQHPQPCRLTRCKTRRTPMIVIESPDC